MWSAVEYRQLVKLQEELRVRQERHAKFQIRLNELFEGQVREMCKRNLQIMRSQSPQTVLWPEYGNVGLKASVDDPFESSIYPC